MGGSCGWKESRTSANGAGRLTIARSPQQGRNGIGDVRRVPAGQALVQPDAFDQAADCAGKIGRRGVLAQLEVELGDRLSQYLLEATHPL